MSGSTTREKVEKVLREAFHIFDEDKSKYIERHELALLIKKLCATFNVEDASDDEILTIFRELDVNGDGRVSSEEYNKLIEELVKIIEEEAQ